MSPSFYEMLFADAEFTTAVGRLMMSSAKLESTIKQHMEANGLTCVKERDTLGALLEKLSKKCEMNMTSMEHLQMVLNERNYFAHRLHCNLNEYPTNEFELTRFINRARSVSTQMEFFSNLFSESLV